MKAHILQYVRCCTVCQQAKPDRAASPGLLMPLPIPKQPWDMISMDFVDGLPQSSKFNCLLVIVDKRPKFAYFLPLAHPYTAASVAQLYLHQVYKIHGLPGSIVSDRDPVFTSHFWQELFRGAGTELRLSIANHPQTDGQTERVNQCVETFLRCFTQACPR
uniref:Integrase catalytic domain-containing protein n=1 Tax=Aegilops tauschii subsp. strangulata TaxID=200361 RepID=A0A452ZYI2_AEGTS